MRDEAERVAIEWGLPMAFAVLAVGVRVIMSADRVTLAGLARGVFVGLFVGGLANAWLAEASWDIGDGTRGALVGVAAVVAEDVVAGLLVIGQRFREAPMATIIQLFRGGRK